MILLPFYIVHNQNIWLFAYALRWYVYFYVNILHVYLTALRYCTKLSMQHNVDLIWSRIMSENKPNHSIFWRIILTWSPHSLPQRCSVRTSGTISLGSVHYKQVLQRCSAQVGSLSDPRAQRSPGGYGCVPDTTEWVRGGGLNLANCVFSLCL